MLKVIVADNVAAEIPDLEATLKRIVSTAQDEQRRTVQPMLILDCRVQGIHGPVWLSVQYLHDEETMRVIFKAQAIKMKAHPECYGTQRKRKSNGNADETKYNWH